MKAMGWLLLILFSMNVSAAEFPTLDAEKLDGTTLALPGGFPDGDVWLIVGFTKASQGSTTVCGDLLEKEFPGKFWSAAILQGIPFFIKGTVKKAIRSAIPENRKSRYLFFFDRKDELKNISGFEEKAENDAYVIHLSASKTGERVREVRFTSHGVCDSSQLTLIRAEMGKH